ncbi:P-loop NTPase [Microbacterium sp.]|uniref:Mrp/NBP35 family ATP-binding protein n=1 Tax=Microbacterium sp. TaxID=51671 RepID=UPI0039E3043A
MTASADAVRAAVGAVVDPELRRPIGELDMVREVAVSAEGSASIGIALTIVGCPAADRIAADVRAAASGVPGVTAVALSVGVMSPAERHELTERLRGGRAARRMPFGPDSLTRVIAVTSGKGGVGKSTLTANLAVALAARGLAVGLVDADVHGFSIPRLLGLVGPDGTAPTPTRLDELMLPPVAYDVKAVSIGMFLRPRPGEAPVGAVAWRGPMLHRTVQQFLTDVYFGDLDVLLIDMPPGTGDIAISVGQLLPGAEVIVVTTPQPAAAEVAVRSGLVARQTGQRVVGVIENMSALTLPEGSTMALFGAGGGDAVAEALSTDAEPVPLLGTVPLSAALRECGDDGRPVVAAEPGDPAARAIQAIAAAIARSPRGLAGRALPLTPR